MKIINPGTNIEYFYKGGWLNGVVHGVITHENPGGIITRIAYLIDTGKTVREDLGVNAKTGKPEIVRQPEQVEVESNQIRAI